MFLSTTLESDAISSEQMEWVLTKLAQKDCFEKTYIHVNLIRKHCEYLTSLNERCNLCSCLNVNSSFLFQYRPERGGVAAVVECRALERERGTNPHRRYRQSTFTSHNTG